MKITKLETIVVQPNRRAWVFVKMYTNEGLIGLGEALSFRVSIVVEAIKELGDLLIGKDPRRIEHNWQTLYRGTFWRGGPVLIAAISAVEQAMWDILGKSLNVPVYTLLGGACRDKIRFYKDIGNGSFYRHITNESLDKLLGKEAEAALDEGFTAIKFTPFGPMKTIDNIKKVEHVASLMKTVRKAVGEKVDIMVDFHGRLSPAMAIVAAQELAPYRPFFLEEPCLPENVDAMAKVANAINVPIATGERLFTKFGVREVLEKHIAAVLQPDLSVCGGIMEGKKIAGMAEAYYVAIAPHNPYGPVLTAASIQLDACIPNFLIQEHTTPGLGKGILKEPFIVKDGYVKIPNKPGLGIELDEEAIKKYPYKHYLHPMFYHEDGSVADW